MAHRKPPTTGTRKEPRRLALGGTPSIPSTSMVCCLVAMATRAVISVESQIPEPDFDSRSLIFVRHPMTWYQAAYVCQTRFHGYLVNLDTQEKEDAFQEFYRRVAGQAQVWIGLQETLNGVRQHTSLCDPLGENNTVVSASTSDTRTRCFTYELYTWPPVPCTQLLPFVCQRTQYDVENRSAGFHVILQANSTMRSCQYLCESLRDCFLASPIERACVVGLVTPDNRTVVLRPMEDTLIGEKDIDNSSLEEMPSLPCPQPDAITAYEGQRQELRGNVVINGSWVPPYDRQCPLPSPMPQSILTIRETVTAIQSSIEHVPVTITVTASEIHPTTVRFVATETVFISTPVVVTIRPTWPSMSASPCPSLPQTTECNSIDTSSTMSLISSFPTSTATIAPLPQSSSEIVSIPPKNSEIPPVSPSVLSSKVSMTSELSPVDVSSTSQQSSSTDGTTPSSPPVTERQTKLTTIDKAKLSRTIRTKTSAANTTTVSHVIGVMTSLPVVVLFALIIIMDIHTKLLPDLTRRLVINVRDWLG